MKFVRTGVARARAAANDGMDDLPLGVLGRVLVCSERDLARATTVRSAALKRESLWSTDRHWGVFSAGGIVDSLSLFAWEVCAGCHERGVVEGGTAEGNWSGHLHVCVDRRCESEGRSHEDVLRKHLVVGLRL